MLFVFIEIKQVEQIVCMKFERKKPEKKTANSLSIVRELMMKLETKSTFTYIIVHSIARTVLLSLFLVLYRDFVII